MQSEPANGNVRHTVAIYSVRIARTVKEKGWEASFSLSIDIT